MNKERAQDIFNNIKKKGMKAINDYILARKTEELFLDFKRSANEGQTDILHQNDRNNLAKAISGFGNSEGGVIVWGVDCAKDLDGADVAKAKIPIKNVERFTSLIEGAISGCTIPPHVGVENHSIKIKGKNEGYVVTLIPKSNNAPHQAIVKNQYYMRAGSSFVPIPHGILAGMFGKRPQPWVYLMFSTGPAKITQLPSGEKEVHCEIGLMLYNGGQGIARDTYLNAEIYDTPGKSGKTAFRPIDRDNWIGNFSFGYKLGVICKEGFRIAPNNLSQPIILEVFLLPPFSGDFKVRLKSGCADGAPHEMELHSTKKNIEETYDQILNATDLSNSQDLVSKLLGIEKGKIKENQ
ncbi:helix-turn-helix domain-containing protein [Thermoproteota archaeon]